MCVYVLGCVCVCVCVCVCLRGRVGGFRDVGRALGEEEV